MKASVVAFPHEVAELRVFPRIRQSGESRPLGVSAFSLHRFTDTKDNPKRADEPTLNQTNKAMRMWWAYLLSSFLGGIVAIAALIIALAMASKRGNMISIHFGGDRITFYNDMELIESAVRPGGIYVKYQNTGTQGQR